VQNAPSLPWSRACPRNRSQNIYTDKYMNIRRYLPQDLPQIAEVSSDGGGSGPYHGRQDHSAIYVSDLT
jgi:hypothetical protein